jgi:hypothetical protein
MIPPRKKTEIRPAKIVSVRARLRGLSSRLPGYVLLLGTILRRRSVPLAYSQALAREAGFGRLPVKVPGSMLPGFRGLGKVAVLGVLLHVFLRQGSASPRRNFHRFGGLSVTGLRDDAGTVLAVVRWMLAAVRGKQPRLRSEA